MGFSIGQLFSDALKGIGLVENQIAQVVQVGQLVRGINFPPATNPRSVYAFLLRALGHGDDIVAKIQGIGQQLSGIGSAIQVLEGADQEFQNGQEVTGSVKLYATEYDYSFIPRTGQPANAAQMNEAAATNAPTVLHL